MRTEVVDKVVDPKLLHHLSILTDGKPISPINLCEPVVRRYLWEALVFQILISSPDQVYHKGRALARTDLQPNTMGYLIVGRGSKSGLIFYFQEAKAFQAIVLSSLMPPTASQIFQYRQWAAKPENPELGKWQHDPPVDTLSDECRNQ